MVLAGDEDAATTQIADRMVGAMVPELHLLRLAAQGESEQLMAETQTEGRDARLDDCPHRVLRLGQRRRIARTIAEQDAIGAEAEDFCAAALWW